MMLTSHERYVYNMKLHCIMYHDVATREKILKMKRHNKAHGYGEIISIRRLKRC